MPVTIPPSAALTRLKTVLKDASKDGELSDGETSQITAAFKPVVSSLRRVDQVEALLGKVKTVTHNLSLGWSKADAFDMDLLRVADSRERSLKATEAVDREFP